MRTAAAILLLACCALGQSIVQITRGPVVEFVNSRAATIAWITNDESTSIVRYGSSAADLSETATDPPESSQKNADGTSTHRVTLEGLRPGAHYYFRVESELTKTASGPASSEVRDFYTRP
jgi:hypothetical protein